MAKSTAKKSAKAADSGPKSDSKVFKKVTEAHKHITAFLNSVSDDENFCLEAFTSGEGIQVVASTHGDK